MSWTSAPTWAKRRPARRSRRPRGDAGGASIGDAAAAIRELLADRSMYFSEIAESVPGVGFQFVARAMGELHAAGEIDQDAEGRYRLASERL